MSEHLDVQFKSSGTEAIETYGPFIGVEIHDHVLWMATGGGAPDEEFADYDPWSQTWRLRSTARTTWEELFVNTSVEPKHTSRIYVFFQTGHPEHPQKTSETYGPFIDALIADEALLVRTADEQLPVELAEYEPGAEWWRRHIGKDYPREIVAKGYAEVVEQPLLDEPGGDRLVRTV
jgi:hypothetical protein